jgi:tetratricopeptide (TPR) repeat protein
LLPPAAQQLWAQEGLPRALELYRSGDYRAAESIFKEILRKEPSNVTIRKMLADCLTQDNRPEEARQEYQRILKLAPGDTDARRVLTPEPPPAAPPKPAAPKGNSEVIERVRTGGDIERAEREAQAGRLPEAAALLESVHKRFPEMILPQQRLAEIYTRTKDFTQAAEIYASLGAKPGGSPTFFQRAGQNYAWAENYEEAARYYRQYLTSRPGDLQVSLELANVLLWSNKLDEAAEGYRRYIERRPDDLDARLNLGHALLWSKRFAPALEEFNRVAARRPRDPELLLSIAQSQEQMGNPELALATYAKVLDLNPRDASAIAGRDRIVANQPRVSGFASLERQDYKAASQFFMSYLEKHPDSTETILQVARVLSWGKQYAESTKYYDLYLQKAPGDKTALRELAKIELTIPVFSRARQDYELLASDPRSTVEDHEGLVHAYSWDGKLASAQPHAKRLLELDPGNEVAVDAIRTFETQERSTAIEKARVLTASGRYSDALAAYKTYTAKYGSTQEIELATCRLLSFNKQFTEAADRYQLYLRKYPQDQQAQVELADNLKWSGDYALAESSYRSALRRDAQEPQALLGLAQILDYRGSDPFRVVDAYKKVLASDATNAVARERLEGLAPQVSPSLGIREKSFSDSDSFGRSQTWLEVGFPMRDGLRVSPYVNYDYFSQYRQIGGSACGATSGLTDTKLIALSEKICSARGISRGLGGGIRIDLAPIPQFSLSAQVGQTQFDNTRSFLDARGELNIRAGRDRLVSATYTRRSAAYDLNTIASMFAGIYGQSAFLSYQQPISAKWRLWLGGGAARYTRGDNNVSPANTQRMFSARAEYKVMPELTAGYFMRASTFSAPSPIYFSPSYYGTYGISYDWNKQVAPNLRMSATGEFAYGRIDRYNVAGVNTVEVAIYPSLVWRVKPSLDLRLGYRFGRGATSSFGAPAYTTGVFDFGVQNYFMDQTRRVDPTRIDIR